MNNDVKLLGVIPINTCSRRRGLLVTFYAIVVLGCVFSWLIHWLGQIGPAIASHVGGSVSLYVGMATSFFVSASFSALASALRGYGFVGSHMLHTSRDEQEQVQHAAYVRAYWVLMTLVCVTSAVFLSSAAWRVLRFTLGFVGKPLVPVVGIILAVSLPSAIIAWTERDLNEAT